MTPPGEHLDVTDLEVRGAQILDRFYDDAFVGLQETARSAAAEFVQANLITRSGARRPYPLADVDATLLPALRHLVNRRLMRIESTDQGDQIELVHDRLAAVALQRAQATQRQAEAAERLRREKEAAELEVLKQQARAAEMAQERARIEKARADDAVRSTRRARQLTAAVAFIGLVALAAALYGWNQSSRAAREILATEAARIDAEAKADQAQKALAAAEGALKAIAEAKNELTALANTTTGADKARAMQATTAVTQSWETAVNVVGQLQACPDGRRLYPQIAQGSDPGVINDLRATLRAKGFIVPRIEEVASANVPKSTEVRYFRKSESDGANLAVETLKAAGLPDVSAIYVEKYENSNKIRPCHYELWIGRGKAAS